MCALSLTLIFLVILIFSPCALVPNSTTVLIPFASTLLCDTTGTTGLDTDDEEDDRSAAEGDTGPSSSPSTSPQFILPLGAALEDDDADSPHLTLRVAMMRLWVCGCCAAAGSARGKGGKWKGAGGMRQAAEMRRGRVNCRATSTAQT